MKYFLIAGEASGDLHASNLMKSLVQEDSQAVFQFWGGDLMAAVGGKLLKHYRELAFMGIVEVVKNLPTIWWNMRSCKESILAFQPDVLILIDYSGFNLRIAKWAKQQGVRIYYYIAPQVWASRPKRTYLIKQYVDQVFAILPFEPAFYEQYGMTIHYVGHPLLDVIAQHTFDADFLQKENIQVPIIALLPGSRKQEISRILEIWLPLIDRFPRYQFVIAGAPNIAISLYREIIRRVGGAQRVKIVQGNTYHLLKNAQAALVTSGTATLETALLDVPQVVCYKGNWFSYQIAKRLIKVPYISLVNLILNNLVVKELIQNELTTKNVETELRAILEKERAIVIKNHYRKLRKSLGERGASRRTAQLMLEDLIGY